jgi:hypothetical protein
MYLINTVLVTVFLLPSLVRENVHIKADQPARLLLPIVYIYDFIGCTLLQV